MAWDPKDPWGRNQDPIDEVLRKAQEQWQQMKPTKGIKSIIFLVVLLVLAWQSVYIVAPDEQGLVKRFGGIVRTSAPGPHFKIPFIESVQTPKVEKLHRIEVGIRTDVRGRTRAVPREALMLTGDMNILSVEFIVQYKIRDAIKYLYLIADVEGTIKKTAEAAMREVIGKSRIDEALTVGKAQIQNETHDLIQKTLDDYQSGVQIMNVQLQDVNPPQQVEAAFKDVASAKEDREKLINQAQSYRNDIIPKAKGKAAEVVNEAEGYAKSRLARAEGEASRFTQTLKEYRQAENVISKRIYIETMEEVLTNVDKVIMDSSASGNVLPYLPLERLRNSPATQVEQRGSSRTDERRTSP